MLYMVANPVGRMTKLEMEVINILWLLLRALVA